MGRLEHPTKFSQRADPTVILQRSEQPLQEAPPKRQGVRLLGPGEEALGLTCGFHIAERTCGQGPLQVPHPVPESMNARCSAARAATSALVCSMSAAATATGSGSGSDADESEDEDVAPSTTRSASANRLSCSSDDFSELRPNFVASSDARRAFRWSRSAPMVRIRSARKDTAWSWSMSDRASPKPSTRTSRDRSLMS